MTNTDIRIYFEAIHKAEQNSETPQDVLARVKRVVRDGVKEQINRPLEIVVWSDGDSAIIKTTVEPHEYYGGVGQMYCSRVKEAVLHGQTVWYKWVGYDV